MIMTLVTLSVVVSSALLIFTVVGINSELTWQNLCARAVLGFFGFALLAYAAAATDELTNLKKQCPQKEEQLIEVDGKKYKLYKLIE